MRLEYLKECYKIVRCLVTRKHDLSFMMFNMYGDTRMLQHCSKCGRYFV